MRMEMGNELTKVQGFKVVKSDDSARIVIGYAVVCSIAGADYFDLHDDNIEQGDLFEAVADFQKSSRVADAMHDGPQVGEVLFSFVMTEEIAESVSMTWTEKAADRGHGPGWLVGVYVEDEGTYAKVRDGSLSCFSIAGTATREDVKGAT